MVARVRQLTPALLILSLWLASGCTASRGEPSRTQLSIFAASSLTEAFQDLERRFEASHPDVDVQLTFAGSQVLRLQLEQGADADVFASANEAHMRALADAGVVSESSTFAHNELVVVVPSNNPAQIESFEDLARRVRLVIGTDNVPVGIYARQLFDRADLRFGPEFSEEVQSHVVSEESNVRLVRAKVELGEADAAIVYRTDAVASDEVRVIAIPSELNVEASYPIGVVSGSKHDTLARQFVAFVLSDEGQQALARQGFLTGAR